MPEVSILMPVKNAASYLRQAVQSVLDQSGVELELIVIEDGSTDGSEDIVASLEDARIRVLWNSRNGIAGALNLGLEHARGDFVARCDADDVWAAGRLAKQVSWLKAHSDFGAICGGYAALDARGDFSVPLQVEGEADEITEELRNGVLRTSLCTFLVRTDVARRTGGFRSFFVTAEDIDFQLRLGEVTRVWYDPALTYFYRVHDASITHRQANDLREFYEKTALEFQRQRKESGADDLERGCPPSPPEPVTRESSSAKAQLLGYLIGNSWALFDRGELVASWRSAWRACRMSPRTVAPWRNLAVLSWKILRRSVGVGRGTFSGR